MCVTLPHGGHTYRVANGIVATLNALKRRDRKASVTMQEAVTHTHTHTQLLNQLSQPAEQSDAERTEFFKHPLHSWNAQRRFFNSFTLFSAHIIETSSCQAGQSEHSTLNWR